MIVDWTSEICVFGYSREFDQFFFAVVHIDILVKIGRFIFESLVQCFYHFKHDVELHDVCKTIASVFLLQKTMHHQFVSVGVLIQCFHEFNQGNPRGIIKVFIHRVPFYLMESADLLLNELFVSFL